MQIKKIIKYSIITLLTVGSMFAVSALSLFPLDDSNYASNTSQRKTNTDHNEQIQYIRNDVQKQSDVTYSVTSISIIENSASSWHAGAIVTKTDGSTLLYMWGSNSKGQAGHTGATTQIPNRVGADVFGSRKIVDVSIGNRHSGALLSDGSLYMWGDNEFGQLGTTVNSGTKLSNPIPTIVESLKSKWIRNVSVGSDFSAALLADGSLYMWGGNSAGQLAFSSNTRANPDPTPMSSHLFGGIKISKVKLGGLNSSVFLADDRLFIWGHNTYGQLTTTASTSHVPHEIDKIKFDSKKIKNLEFGSSHCAAVMEDGSLYMWGSNSSGQLGTTVNNLSLKGNPIPTQVPALKGKNVTQVSLGYSHSAAVVTEPDGSKLLFIWGLNHYGELGYLGENTGGKIFSPDPKEVTTFKSKKIVKVSLSFSFSTVVTEDNNLYMWGWNVNGQLGFPANGNVANPTPTWMNQLGKDSHMTGKPTMTAKEATNNFWVGNSFVSTGFKSSFNLFNIPEDINQRFTMDPTTPPSYDIDVGTVTMNIYIKFFYDENGLIRTNTAEAPMIISGFKSGITTNIKAKDDTVNPMVVDKWSTYVTVNGEITRAKLAEFVTFIDVPNEAKLTVTEIIANNETGVLTFKVATSKVTDGYGAIINAPSNFRPFSIALNLTPRVTKMTPITSGYPSNFYANALKTKLFDNNWLIKDVVELRKYVKIVVPVDAVSYRLVDGTWSPHAGDGTVKFDIYVSQYYDSKGELKTGGASVAGSKVSFDLKLQNETSAITLKTSLPNIRVHEFENYIRANGNTVTNGKLKDFFNLTNIPSSATFTVADVRPAPYNDNFTRNRLTFDLTINKFNQGTPATPQLYKRNYELILGVQHQPTVITEKSTYDRTLEMDTVANKLTTLSGDALLNYLRNFINIESVPDGALIAVQNVNPNESTNKLSFEVIPGGIYNANSDLVNSTTGQFTFNLQFNVIPDPTNMTINASYTKIRIDEFANNINTLKGDALYNYLVRNYVIATSVDATKLTAEITSQDNLTGNITISLMVSSYYNDDSVLVTGNKSYSFEYVLIPKYQQTTIKILDESTYPKNITPAQFKKQIIDDGATSVGDNHTLVENNITFLKRFMSLASVPESTVYTLTWNAAQTNDVTGVLSFNLILSRYYSADGYLVTSPLPANNITLNLLATPLIYPETKITVKTNAPLINSVQSFLDTVYPDGVANTEKLGLYVDGLQTIPTIANISNITLKSTNDSVATFALIVSAHYDASGKIQGSKSFDFRLSLAPKYSPTNIAALPVGSYPSDLTPDQFKRQLVNDGATANGSIYTLNDANIVFLNKFLDLNTVPPITTYTLILNNEQTSNATGQLKFNLIVNQYYNIDGILVINATQPSNDLVLKLANVDAPTIRSATHLKTRVNSPAVASVEAFLEKIRDTTGNLNYSQLNLFVDGLATVPTNATATVNYITGSEVLAVFQITIFGYYDGLSPNMISDEKTYDFQVRLEYITPVVNDQFPWWWILIAAGPTALIGVVIWLSIERHKDTVKKAIGTPNI